MKTAIVNELKDFLKDGKKIVVVGVGNELRGDDGVGVAVANILKKKMGDRVTVLLGGMAPENITGKIKRLNPSHLIFIDAADFGGSPGDVIIADPHSITWKSISTHTLPLSMISEYLKKEMGVKVLLLGIQVEQSIFGSEMGPKVAKAVDKVTSIFEELLQRRRINLFRKIAGRK
ncbi:MAG: hydrogenase maturation peptidase HycI [Candidatus Hadarchaeales archaeon]